MLPFTIEQMEQDQLRFHEIANDLVKKAATLESDVLTWNKKYNGLSSGLKEYFLRDEKPAGSTSNAGPEKSAKVIPMETKPSETPAKEHGDKEPKMIHINEEMLTPREARKHMLPFFRFIDDGWKNLIEGSQSLNQRAKHAAREEHGIATDSIYFFSVLLALKSKATQSDDDKKTFEDAMQGLPVALTDLAKAHSDLLLANYNAIEKSYAAQKAQAALHVALRDLIHSSYAFLNGLLKYGAQCMAEHITPEENLEEAVQQVATLRSVMMDVLYKHQENFLLQEDLILLYDLTGIQLHRFIIISLELEK